LATHISAATNHTSFSQLKPQQYLETLISGVARFNNLQITTINNFESWHKSLKSGVKGFMRHWTLKGAI
jgi:hypothetical protein